MTLPLDWIVRFRKLSLFQGDLPSIDWICLSANPHPIAIYLLSQNLPFICWTELSSNEGAFSIIEKYPDNIVWDQFSLNTSPCAIKMMEKNLHKVNWYHLSLNPAAVDILFQNMDKIHWENFSRNTNKRAIMYLSENLDKISLYSISSHPLLSKNPLAIPYLVDHPDRISWFYFSQNPGISLQGNNRLRELICQNLNRLSSWECSGHIKDTEFLRIYRHFVDRHSIWQNPVIFGYNYKAMKKRMIDTGIAKELIENRMHPKNMHLFDDWGF